MANNKYCSQCKEPAEQDQKYCERCGSRLPDTSGSSRTPPAPQKSQHPEKTHPTEKISFGLLDPCQLSYVIKEHFLEGGSSPIYNDSGQHIGKIQRKLQAIRENIEMLELDDTIVASVHRKLVAIRPTFALKDGNEKLLGHFEKTLLNLLHPKFYLKNPQGEIILTAQGKLMGFDFMIYRGELVNSNNLVAEIHKADRWDSEFFSGTWDFTETYGIRVLHPTIDRRMVLGFVIAIDDLMRDV